MTVTMFYFLIQPFSFNAFPVPYYNFLTGHSCNNSGTFTCMSDNFHVSTLLRHVFIAMDEDTGKLSDKWFASTDIGADTPNVYFWNHDS